MRRKRPDEKKPRPPATAGPTHGDKGLHVAREACRVLRQTRSDFELVVTFDPPGRVTALLWDGFGNRVGTIDPSVRQTTFRCISQGLLTGQVDALGNQASLLYDSSGKADRLIATVNPLGFAIRFGIGRPRVVLW